MAEGEAAEERERPPSPRNSSSSRSSSSHGSRSDLPNTDAETVSSQGSIPSLSQLDSSTIKTAATSPSETNSAVSVQTVVPKDTEDSSVENPLKNLEEIQQLSVEEEEEEEKFVEEASASKEFSGVKSASNRGSGSAMKKSLNALLPKFKSNKLEPLNVDPNVPSTSSDYVGPVQNPSLSSATSKVSKKNKKLKRSNKGKGGHKGGKGGGHTVTINIEGQIVQPSTSASASSRVIAAQEIVGNNNNNFDPNGNAVPQPPGAIGNGSANVPPQQPTIQVVEVDAADLRRKSKVIFAVPQYPGQPVIPIAYKLTNRRPSGINGGDQNGTTGSAYSTRNSPAGLLNNDMHFEVVWRNLVYYHASTLKKLKEAKKSGGGGGGGDKEEKKVKGDKTGDKKGKKGEKGNGTGVPNSSTIPPHRQSIIPRNGQPRPTLNNISGSFRSGQMTAIMGPSGAGKTVFLNCITGHLSINASKANSGDILVNGVRSIRIGFVEQFDHLLPQLTVRETLLFASRIKNAARYYLNHVKIAENVISRLDLADCADSYTAKCSNGQRKRLSIAIELCFNSDILILDEPTTGLDAVTGFQIMNTLKALTKRRRAISILATIHQPSPRMFQLFDHLIVLSREGTIMYQGSPGDLPQTLSLVGLTCPLYSNISDFLLEVASGDFGRQTLHLLSHYNKEYNQMRIAEDLNEVEVTSLQEAVRRSNQVNQRSFVLCTWLLFIRTLVCNWRNPFNSQIRIISVVFTAIFLGLVFTDVVGSVSTCPPTKYFLWKFSLDEILEETSRQQQHAQENMGIVFMMALVSLFNSMLNTVVTFSFELQVFRREHDNFSYSILSFYLAKLAGDLPFTMPTTALFVVGVHRMTGQIFDMWARLWLAVLPCCMATLIGQFIGMTIGTLFVENIMASVFSIIFIIIPLIMFSGFFRLVADMDWFMAQLSVISFIKQIINSLMIAIYGLGRCEHEDEVDRAAFEARNLSEAEARPGWITSMVRLIEYQKIMAGEDEEPNGNSSLPVLGPEEKLVRYMGLNIDPTDRGGAGSKVPLILQHFSVGATYEAYWTEITNLCNYVLFFAVLLYLVMFAKYTRRN